MRPLLLLVPALLAALDLPTPALEVHPDGTRVAWSLNLPAGNHRLDLPTWCGETLNVRGATAWTRQIDPGTPAPLPAALAALLPDHNRLVVQATMLAAARKALNTAEQRWQAALLARGEAGEADTAAWQAGLDALLAERTRLDGDELHLANDRRAFTERAIAVGGQAAAKTLAGQRSLTASELSRSWSRVAGSAGRQIHLDVQLAVAGTVRIEEQRDDCRWRAECDLRVAAGKAILARRAVLEKHPTFAPGPVAITVSAGQLALDLAAPEIPAVALIAAPVEESLRKLVSGGRRQATWDEVPAATSTMVARSSIVAKDSIDGMHAAVGDTEVGGQDSFMAIGAGGGGAGMFGSRTGGACKRAVGTFGGSGNAGAQREDTGETVIAPASVTYDLGSIDLAAGSDRIVVALGEAPLTVTADEWAMFPEERPAALRRVTVKLDGRPLLPGRIRVVGEGQLPVDGSVPWVPGGGSLTVCAGIDERIVVVSSTVWDRRQGDDLRKRRREGRDTWLVNSGGSPATVAVYRTMPVSTVDEVTVEQDAETTPGGTAMLPGLLRWRMVLPTGVPTRVGLGCTLKAGGSFSFE